MARVSDQSEKYEEMILIIKEIVWKSSGEAPSDFICFLSFDFINFISSLRYDLKSVQSKKAYTFSCSSIFKSVGYMPRLKMNIKTEDGVGVGAGVSVSAGNETPSESNPRGNIIFNKLY